MSHLNISLLGGFEVSLDGQPLTAFGADKARALLAYLAIESDRPHRRDALATVLWPESPAKKAAHSLSQTLLRLRRALHEDGGAVPFLLLDNQEIRFNLLSNFRLDVTDFLELLHAQRQHRQQHAQHELCRVCVGWLEQAVALYKGDFLMGFSLRDSIFFEEWQLMQQEVLHGQIIDALALLTTYYEQHGELEKVRDYARRLVTLEPWQERPQLQLMTALVQCGQGDAALKQYAAFSRTLLEEFGVTPSTQARTLFEQIQAGHAELQCVAQISGARKSLSRLPWGATAESEERRQVTALTCDRYNPTADSDPEAQVEVLAHCRAHCEAILAQYGGQRQPRQGTSCLVYFGYPVAEEDAASRAVYAGLALSRAADIDEPVCIGIHTGTMVVSVDGLVGAAPSLARACQQLAAPQGVLVTAHTERLVRGKFVCRPVDVPVLPDIPETLAVYRVEGEAVAQSRLEWLAQLHRLTRFVGREPELAQLAAYLAAARSGQGGVIAISGEPGVGKSRLIWELRQRESWPGLWLESSCTPYRQTTPLFPLIRLLEQLFGIQSDDTPETRSEKLTNVLAQLDLAQPANGWLLALLLGLPTAAPVPPTITEGLRQRMYDVCLAALSQYALAQPLVLVIEDLHWADPSTIAWLDAAMDALAVVGCLVLLTYRPTFVPLWRARASLHYLALGPLSPEQVELLVSCLVGSDIVSEAARQRVLALTDGNPLFVEELTWAVLEADPQTTADAIPATLRDSLLARLDRVGAAKETVGWAAVLGREFAYSILAAVVPYPEQRLQADLITLIEADLIIPTAGASQRLYAFRHGLIQETAYASLLKRTRQARHRRIAAAYVASFPQLVDTQPEVLAEHYHRAGQFDQAVDQWMRAAEHAVAQGAIREAQTLFTRALQAVSPQDHTRRWRALLGRTGVLFLAGDRAAERTDIAALLSLAEMCDNPAWRAEALLCQLRYFNAVGDYPKMLPLADVAIAAAQGADAQGPQARALCLKAAALTRLGEPSARETAEEAVACGRAAGDEWASAYATGMLALHAAYVGDYAHAAQAWGEVLDMVRRSGDYTLESRALSNLGAAYQYLGRFDEARRYLEAGIALCDLVGDRHSRAYNVVNLGGVMLLCGDPAAKSLFEHGLIEATALDDASLRAGMLWDLGWLTEMAGEYEHAIAYLENARQSYADLGMLARQMETDARLAKCAVGQGHMGAARERALTVWDYLREHGAVAMDEALPTYLALAEVFEALGDDAMTQSVIVAGYELVMTRAAQISDSLWRQSFLENVPSNQAVVARWRRIHPED
jgi:DNA-binding SARP family transcriptional activator/tetratricopeptide (TPR) repeat protein